ADRFGAGGPRLYDAAARELRLAVDHGQLVTEVVEGRPAARAGIRAGHSDGSDDSYNVPTDGDVIQAMDDRAIDTVDDVAYYTNSRPFGSTSEVALLRGGRELTVPVQLGGAPLPPTPSPARGGGEGPNPPAPFPGREGGEG